MIIKKDLKNDVEHQYEILQLDKYSAYYVNNQLEVSYGRQNDIDIVYCTTHNIPAYFVERDGGCIVYSKGNLSWADVRRNDTKDFKLPNLEFLKDFAKYLKNKGLNVTLDNNDILVDGYKVTSGGAINIPPNYTTTYSGVQISINTDVDAIKNICKKEMKKVPRGLGYYGITTQEVEQFIVNWFKEVL